MSKESAVRVRDLSKHFVLPHSKRNHIKEYLIHPFARTRKEVQHALENVSFEIKQGEFVGVVGRNGSGKSTLLKILAGVYTPTSGAVEVSGTLVPFIELGVGFNPELTGRDNIFLNGALLGFSRNQMEDMYEDIVDFAELERFMDQKLKNYSSGMQVRLAFSIAIKAQGDILLLDEVLAVGDAAFQQKCFDYFEKIKKDKKTVVFVSHSMDSIKRYCDRAVLLESGKVKSMGSPEDIANEYTLENLNANASSSKKQQQATNKHLTGPVKRLDVRALSSLVPSGDENFEFEVTYELTQDLEVDLGVSFIYQGQSVVEHNTSELNLGHKPGKKYKVRYSLPLINFLPKNLRVDVAIFERKEFKLIGYHTNSLTFAVRSNTDTIGGLLNIRGDWTVVS